jgi:hypothetical protein
MRSNSRVACLFVMLFLVPAFARSKERVFDQVVHRVESHFHKRPVRFMGLATFLANRARPEGVHHMRLAVFEDLDRSPGTFDVQFDSFLQQTVEPEYQPFVQVRSNRDGEQTYVYARAVGKEWKLLVVSLERDEVSIIEMQMKADAMSEWFDEPAKAAKGSSNNADNDPE